MSVLGAASSFAPDFLLRQLLLEGLSVLAADNIRLAELYARYDTVTDGSQSLQPAAFIDRIKALTSWGTEDELTIRLGYPHEHARLPAVSIVLDGGAENPGSAVFGDVFARTHELIGVDDPLDWSTQKCIQHIHKVVEFSSRVQIGSWATGPEEGLLVHEAVRNVLFTDKQWLADFGIRDVTMSEGGVVPDAKMHPRVQYIPMLTANLTWDLRHTRRRRVPSRVKGTASYRNS